MVANRYDVAVRKKFGGAEFSEQVAFIDLFPQVKVDDVTYGVFNCGLC